MLREVEHPVVVLGSTQPSSIVDAESARRSGILVSRRRSGGGAVLLLPGAQVWADLWLPRGDPLWSDEPRMSVVVAGEWWARSLDVAGAGLLKVHRGPSIPALGSEVVCFAGVGPGEVCSEGRKLVGLAQWRSREGALVHGCAYRRWEPGRLVDLLSLRAVERHELSASLVDTAIGLEDLGGVSWSGDALLDALPEGPAWEVLRA